MKIKSYFTKSIETAIQQARQELGADAVLITSRRTAAESRNLGDYEVVFGIGDGAVSSQTSSNGSKDELSSELRMLRSQLSDLSKQLGVSPASPASMPEVETLKKRLLRCDFPPELVEELIGEALSTQLQAAPGLLEQAVAALLVERIRLFEPPPAPAAKTTSKLIVFVGPHGAGKTSALVKMAVLKCLGQSRTARILSLDTHRVAGHEPLRTYAEILGIGFSAFSACQQLPEALQESRTKDFVLLDTPGYSFSEMGFATEVARILSNYPNREVHLVLPASMKRENLAVCADRFSVFAPHSLLFTRLDETESLGAPLSESLRLKKPLSFFSTGPGIPEDFSTPDIPSLVETLLGTASGKSASAA